MSSWLTQVTVLPAGTVIASGSKVKFSILDRRRRAGHRPGGAGGEHEQSNAPICPRTALSPFRQRLVDDRQRGRGLVVKATSAGPQQLRAAGPAGTFIGPGEAALPGSGCGKAVDMAVWNVMLPSTFCIIWWMWPLSTVTEPKRFR